MRYPKTQWPLFILLALLISTGMVACGKRGPLYLPDDKTQSPQK